MDTRRAMADINITPLIDVMLVLLIIFMVVTPVATRGLDAALPQPADRPVTDAPPPPSVVLTIAADSYLLNHKPVGSAEELRQHLADLYATRADKTLFVKSAPDVPYRRIVAALDTARDAGVLRLGLVGDEPVAHP